MVFSSTVGVDRDLLEAAAGRGALQSEGATQASEIRGHTLAPCERDHLCKWHGLSRVLSLRLRALDTRACVVERQCAVGKHGRQRYDGRNARCGSVVPVRCHAHSTLLVPQLRLGVARSFCLPASAWE